VEAMLIQPCVSATGDGCVAHLIQRIVSRIMRGGITSTVDADTVATILTIEGAVMLNKL